MIRMEEWQCARETVAECPYMVMMIILIVYIVSERQDVGDEQIMLDV